MTPSIYRILVFISLLFSELTHAETTWIPIQVGEITTIIPYIPNDALAAPTNVQTSLNNGVVTLTWQNVKHASQYQIQALNTAGQWVDILVTDELSVVIDSRFAGFTSIRVMACTYNSCASTGTWSAQISLAGINKAPDFATIAVGEAPSDASGFSDAAPTASSVLGAISGSGGVSGGSASYNIPIVVPPGRNGMQPNVQLSYSSSQGNGVAGVGWSLSSSSVISRCGMTVATDGVSKAVQYSENSDKLCLNGQRLIAVSTYGQSGSEYRTELDSFSRIKQYGGNINSTETYFVVEHKNGLVETYGDTTDAKHSAYGRTETLTWAISKKEDRASNNIKYSYYQPQTDSGEHLLRYIKYTGHNGKDGNRLVTYHYGDRSQFSSSYLAGGLTRKTKRLTSISTAVNGTMHRTYTLKYENSLASGRSLLKSVKECGVSKCLPVTTFQWQEKAPEFTFEKLKYAENGTWTEILQDKRWLHEVLPHGDTNGDGVRDFPGIYLNAEGEKTGTHDEKLSTCFKLPNAFQESCLEVDLNADGLTDSFRENNSLLEIKYTNTSQWINTGIVWHHTQGFFQQSEILGFSDFNGDGFPDLAMRQRLHDENSKLWVFFNTKSSASPFNNNNKKLIVEYPDYKSLSRGGFYDDLISIKLHGDLDGNGTADFIVFDSDFTQVQAPGLPLPLRMLLVNPNGTTFSTTSKALTGRVPSYNYNGNIFHDINGDGLVDWLSMAASSSELLYRLNTGGDFESEWKTLDFNLPSRGGVYETSAGEYEPYFYPVMSRFTVMDYDGNGIQDLMLGSDIVASSCAKILSANVSSWKCDDALYTGFNKSLTGSTVDRVQTSINADIVDDSIRRYDAVKFVQAKDGGISVAIEETSILASSTQRAVADVTGDGLPDLITTLGCRFSDCEWNTETSERSGTVQNTSLQAGVYINRNLGSADGTDDDRFAAQDILKAVTNGFGKRDEWVYKPLSSDAYDTSHSAFYSADHAATINDNDYFNFASSMNVVAEHKVSNGIGGENRTLYRYRDAMFNNKGRGFQGFKSIIIEQDNFENELSEAHRDTISRTDFVQKWPLTGIKQQSCKWLASNVSVATDDNKS